LLVYKNKNYMKKNKSTKKNKYPAPINTPAITVFMKGTFELVINGYTTSLRNINITKAPINIANSVLIYLIFSSVLLILPFLKIIYKDLSDD